MGGEASVDSPDHLLDTGPLTRLAEALSSENLSVEVAGKPEAVGRDGDGLPRGYLFSSPDQGRVRRPPCDGCDEPPVSVSLTWNKPHLVEVTTSLHGRRRHLYPSELGIGRVAGGSAVPVERWQGRAFACAGAG